MASRLAMIDSGYKNNDERIKEDEDKLEKMKEEALEAEGDSEKEAKQEEETVSKKEDLDDEESTWKDRYGNLRRHLADKEKSWKKDKEDLQTQLDEIKGSVDNKEEPSADLPKNKKELMEWKKEYPDVSAIMEEFIKEEAARLLTQEKEKNKEKFDKYDQITADLSYAQAMAKIRKKHSDVDEIVAHDNKHFHEWVEEQPQWFADMIYDQHEDTGAIIRILDIYKKEVNLPKTQKKKEADAAKGISTKNDRLELASKGDGKLRESDIRNMSSDEYAERQDEIRKLMAKGEIIMDISGAAM